MDPMTMMAAASIAAPVISNLMGGGQKDKLKKVPTKSKGQLGALDTSLQQLQQMAGSGYQDALGLLQGLLDPESEIYKNFEAPYMQQFQQQILPQLAEQFAGLGGGMGGASQSSGYAQAQGAAAANLQASLAQMKERMRMDASQGILNQYNTQFGQAESVDPFAYTYQRGGPSTGQAMLQGAAQGASSYLSNQYQNRQTPQVNQNPTMNPLTNTYDQMFRSGQLSYT